MMFYNGNFTNSFELTILSFRGLLTWKKLNLLLVNKVDESFFNAMVKSEN